MKALAMQAIAFASLSTAAHAATIVTFTPGGHAPASGQSVIYDFDTTFPTSVITGPLVQYKLPPSDSAGAPPANSMPGGTQYLSVLGGGLATVLFPLAQFPLGVSSFSFDWGSLDSYNVLTILPFSGTDSIVIPGTTFTNPANGNQVLPSTNGLLTVVGTQGTTFKGFVLESSSNSFEIDNVSATAVPEPTTWTMLVLGLGGVGAAMRFRRKSSATTA